MMLIKSVIWTLMGKGERNGRPLDPMRGCHGIEMGEFSLMLDADGGRDSCLLIIYCPNSFLIQKIQF